MNYQYYEKNYSVLYENFFKSRCNFIYEPQENVRKTFADILSDELTIQFTICFLCPQKAIEHEDSLYLVELKENTDFLHELYELKITLEGLEKDLNAKETELVCGQNLSFNNLLLTNLNITELLVLIILKYCIILSYTIAFSNCNLLYIYNIWIFDECSANIIIMPQLAGHYWSVSTAI